MWNIIWIYFFIYFFIITLNTFTDFDSIIKIYKNKNNLFDIVMMRKTDLQNKNESMFNKR